MVNVVFCFRDPQFKEMLDLMAMLKKGYCDGIKVRIGRLQNLISSSCIGESLHYINPCTQKYFCFKIMFKFKT